MTPEEATQLYNIEQRKYYEYCGYVVSYQNKIGEYQSERQNKRVQVENKQTEIQKNRELLEAISGHQPCGTVTSRIAGCRAEPQTAYLEKPVYISDGQLWAKLREVSSDS